MKIFKHFSLAAKFIIVVMLLLSSNSLIASQIPTGQDVGSVETSQEQTTKRRSLFKKLKKPKKEAVIEDKESKPKVASDQVKGADSKVLIKKINVTGATLITSKQIDAIISPYEGKKLSLADFRTIADSITSELRSLGYATSYAYLPPQKVENNTIRIEVTEGRVGDITIDGNKYFNTKRLLSFIRSVKGDLFNYDSLREDLNYINEHPDRNAKVVLVRGKDPGATDLNISVADRPPVHVTLGYSNYNSRYVERNKYSAEFKATNMLGFDDIATVEAQMGEAGRYELYSARYLFPLTRNLKIGASYIHIEQTLGRNVSALDIKGIGDVVSLYLPYKIIDTDNFAMSINPGFDYKEIDNEILKTVISQDNMRIAKIGVDIDMADRFNGRTIIVQSFDYGIDDILGGLKYKDPKASRAGSGGRFFRSITNLARVQSLPASMSLMLKGAAQLTAYNLTSSEQFSIGGITTVRGYPNTEQTGDKGYNASAELFIPPYFLPKKLKVPYTESTFFDALRLVGFVDWGRVELNNPQVGESKHEQLLSVGPAVRFNIPDKMSISFDYGFQLGQDASDGSETRGYVEAKLFF